MSYSMTCVQTRELEMPFQTMGANKYSNDLETDLFSQDSNLMFDLVRRCIDCLPGQRYAAEALTIAHRRGNQKVVQLLSSMGVVSNVPELSGANLGLGHADPATRELQTAL